MGHILRQTDDEPEKATTLCPSIPFPQTNKVLRVGKPRLNWIEETMKLAWTKTHVDMGETDDTMNVNNRGHIQTLNIAAYARLF